MEKIDTKKTNTKVSVNALERVVKSTFTPTTQVEWNGIALEVKKVLSLNEMLEFVSNVVESCFSSDTGAYLPEVKDFAMRCAVLEYYGNFSLPENTEYKYELVYGSDAVMFVMQHVDGYQFNEMMSAIDKKIEHRAQSNIEALTKQMNDVINGLSEIEKSVSEIFGGVDNATITKIAEAIAGGSFDESKLVSAFMEQRNSAAGEQ